VTNVRPVKPTKGGKVRMARLTDLAALGELSRLSQDERSATRSLGLPVSGPPIGVFSLFRLPLGAFQPHDLMYVYEEAGRLSGLIRVERDTIRDEWTIVELDGIGSGQAGDIRFRLVNQVLREAAKRGPWRLHVACTDQDGKSAHRCREMLYEVEHRLRRCAFDRFAFAGRQGYRPDARQYPRRHETTVLGVQTARYEIQALAC